MDVKEQTPLFDTQGSSVDQVIEGRQVQETPLNGRNVMNLVMLVAGVVPQGGTQGSSAGNYAASGDITNASGFGNYQIGGGLAGQNAFLFDGSPLNELFAWICFAATDFNGHIGQTCFRTADEDLRARLQELTAGKGVERAIDCVAGELGAVERITHATSECAVST